MAAKAEKLTVNYAFIYYSTATALRLLRPNFKININYRYILYLILNKRYKKYRYYNRIRSKGTKFNRL